jgi:hypothetical protein
VQRIGRQVWANCTAKEKTPMTQRMTTVLLLLLVLGVWGLLLRPAITPMPVQAQDGGTHGSGLTTTSNGLYYTTPNGYIYRFAPNLTLLDRAVPVLRGIGAETAPTYLVVHEHP